MKHHLAHITFLVKGYDEAISFFVNKLQFELLEDTDMGNGKRWVVVSPRGSNGCSLLLAKATTPEQIERIGSQTGGRVAFFLHTDNFERDYNHMKQQGVEFTEEPRNELYGTVVVFKDLYGNKWDFIEPKNP
jgi:catechol 2,3-dioxygenase-like lactoylglutathione lyase family enzyme